MTNETIAKVRRRRRYSEEFKRQVLAQCEAAGASVAKVAMAHGINANIVHGWRKRLRANAAQPLPVQSDGPGGFVPVIIAEPAYAKAQQAQHVQVQLRCGATVVKVNWPLAAAAQMGAWLREVLR